MDNKLKNMLDDFFKENEGLSEEELNAKLHEFMIKYNFGGIDYEETDMDKAYSILEKAEAASSEKQAMKLAKEAYQKYPECFDALLMQVDLEEDMFKRQDMLEEGLKKEKERLTKEGFFDKENIGKFYLIFETRPYIRGLYEKAMSFFMMGKNNKSVEVCKEILRLNKGDNLGARYLLMALYAMLENEKEIVKLLKKYPEENLEMLLPMVIIYFKLGDDIKAKEYLKRVNKANKYLVDGFKGVLNDDEMELDDYYQPGEKSEVLMYLHTYFPVILNTPALAEFVIRFSKVKQKN